MRILILRSEGRQRADGLQDAYTEEFKSSYADRVVGNLIGREGFCASCGPDCNACRKPYRRNFDRNIAAVIALPGVLPYLLEEPAVYVPRDIPPHDILLAINVHQQILIEFIKRCVQMGTRGVVVPVEAPGWVRGAARSEAEAICGQGSVEVSFPKPFCSFDPPAGGVLAEFRRRFHIGKPAVNLTVRDGMIEQARVDVSAACGATYYVARWLVGSRVDEDLEHEVISKRVHSYPCTASMQWDDEIGDTILHLATQAHYQILAPLRSRPAAEHDVLAPPPGRIVHGPATTQQNIQNIDRAKQAILADLSAGRTVSLESLRNRPNMTAAAVTSAMLILKQEGKILTKHGKFVKP